MLAVSLKTCPPPATARRSIGPGGGHADATVEVARPLAEWLDGLPAQAAAAGGGEGGSSSSVESAADAGAQQQQAQNADGAGNNNAGPNLPDFGSSECVTDLTRLEVMRHELSRLWTSPHSLRSSSATRKLDDALSRSVEYAACLTECLRRNLGSGGTVPGLVLAWRGAFVDTAHPLEREVHLGRSLTFERYAVLFNVAAMEGCRASRFARSALAEGATKAELTKGLKGALEGFGRAASTYAHLRRTVERDTAEASQAAAQAAAQGEGQGDDGGGTDDSNAGTVATNPQTAPSIPPLSPDLTPGALLLCESLHLAHGQMCVYRTALARPRPMHPVLAKVAAGAADLYDTARAHLLDPTPHEVYGSGGGVGLGGEGNDNGPVPPPPVWPNLVSTLSDRATSSWDGYLRAAGGACRARAEWHESFSAAAKDKKDAAAKIVAATENGNVTVDGAAAAATAAAAAKADKGPGPHEAARLRRAVRWTDDAATALRMVEGGTVAFNAVLGPGASEIMSEEIRTLRATVSEKLEAGKSKNAAASSSSSGGDHHRPKEQRTEGQMQRAENSITGSDDDENGDAALDLPAVIGQNMMKRLPPVHPDILDPSRLRRRMFTTLLGPGARRVLAEFRSALGASLRGAAESAQHETDAARGRLAEVNLPQSLDAYTASREAGGGVPPRMWEAIESVQGNDEIDLLRRNLWALKDVADHARSTLVGSVRHLDDDVESDRLFRVEHPDFRGHDAARVQDPLRGQVRSWEGWLEQARNGDEKLLCVLNEFETEPKYQLLQCTRGQLEQLIPGRNGDGSNSGDDGGGGAADPGDIDTAALRASLADLSGLIRDRQVAVEEFKAKADAHELRPTLVEINSSSGDDDNGSSDANAAVTAEDADAAMLANLRGQPAAAPQAVAAASPDEAAAAGGDNENPVKLRRFQEAAHASLHSFSPYLDTVRRHNDRQSVLLERILEENAMFRAALDRNSAAHRGQEYVQKLEDALMTVDRVKRQLTEGRNFYDVVMPRLERLREEVSDLSARLVAERLEFTDRMEMSGDREERETREREDAEMAARLANGGGDSEGGEGAAAGPPRQSSEELRRDEEVAAEMARQFREERDQAGGGGGSPGEGGANDPPAAAAAAAAAAGGGSGNSSADDGAEARSEPPSAASLEPASAAAGAGSAASVALSTDVASSLRGSGTSIESGHDSLGRLSLQGEGQDEGIQAARRASLAVAADPEGAHSRRGSVAEIRSRRESLESSSGQGPDDSQQAQSSPSSSSQKHRPRTPPPPGQPGVYHVSNDSAPMVRVDDEKLARFVQMGFDSEKARRALQRFDNNESQALEDLLTSGT